MSSTKSLRRFLSSSTRLGAFSPRDWHIEISASRPKKLSALPKLPAVTLNHEFGHLLHYMTSYVGLSDLACWCEAVIVLDEPRRPEETEEQQVTRISRKLIGLARKAQRLAIDDEYYYEQMLPLMEAAADAANHPWIWSEVTAGLFLETGEISTHRFWGLRFYIDEVRKDRAFLRLPVGLRTLTEHMAAASDFLGEIYARSFKQRIRYINGLKDHLFSPTLQHYYELVHRLSSSITKRTGDTSLLSAFLAAGLVAMLSIDIPFDDPGVWQSLKNAAQAGGLDVLPQMDHPHPSFVPRLLIHAIEDSDIALDALSSPEGFVGLEQKLLTFLGVPSLEELNAYRDQKLAAVISLLEQSPTTQAHVALIRWLEHYATRLSRLERLFQPAKYLGDECPVPIIFDDDVLDGAVFSLREVIALADRNRRYGEMLRYPVFRDIIPV